MAKKIITTWEPNNFQLQTHTVWSFPERGDWATHDAKWRGNWSPYVPRNLLLRYTQVGDMVLDQFVGGGTTLVEAKLLNRNSIGVDMSNDALERCQEKIDFDRENSGIVQLHKGDARNLNFIEDASIDFICTHPPYANIITYSNNLQDLSQLEESEFLQAMVDVAKESFRVLKKKKYCAVMMGDIRKKGYVVPLGHKVMQIFINNGFYLKELIIKEQHNCKATHYWEEKSKKYNFLLLSHEHLFVFQKKT